MSTPVVRRLYHPILWVILLLSWVSSGCSSPEAARPFINVNVRADGENLTIQVPSGSSVQQILDTAGLSVGNLDRVEPPTYTPISKETSIHLVRVTEKFEVEQLILPYEQLRLPTELLPEGEMRLDSIQPGETGLQEVTYRIVYEDGAEVSREAIKSVTVKEPQAQIMLVGVQRLFSPFSIPGRLVYLQGGNAWMMEQTTSNRRPVVTTGDLDGRVFSLSSDASRLLFTRSSNQPDQINTLWAAKIDAEPVELLDLKVSNVVHFADWVPGSNNRVAYSTVEARPAAPGWQSNNDLNYLTLYQSGPGSFSEVELKEGIGGSYGWWGVNFTWAPDGQRLAYSNSNGIGYLGTTKEETPTALLEFNPLQTRSDWAWIPGLSWGPDSNLLYTVEHSAQPGMANPDESQLFDLTAVSLQGGPPVRLVSNVGMFAFPVASPLQFLPNGEVAYQVAYLQAVFPNQSETSPYRLMVMDRDGSNRKALFPGEGEPGLDPQQVIWSPAPLEDGGRHAVAVIYRGNLWLIESGVEGEPDSYPAWQITGDELISRIDWEGK